MSIQKLSRSTVTSIHSLIVSLLLVATADSGHAVFDPCYRENNTALRADRNVVVAENFLDRTIFNADNVQNSLALQIANLQARVEEARGQANAANATANGNFGGCAITGIFFGFTRFGGCFGRGVANGAAQRARAQAFVNTSIARLNSFILYAEGRTRREQQRIVNAQGQVDRRRAELDAANNALNQCRILVITQGSDQGYRTSY